MPVRVHGPDGKTYQFPDGTDKDAAVRYFKSHNIGVSSQSPEPDYSRVTGLRNEIDKLSTVTPEDEAGHSFLTNQAQKFGAGVIGSTAGVVNHPIKTVEDMAHSATPDKGLAGAGEMLLGPAGPMAVHTIENLIHNPAQTAGGIVGGSLLGDAGGEVLGAAGKAGSAIRDAAIGDPDVSAIRAAGVPKKAALGFKSDVQAARPYLSGSKSVEDVQNKAGLGGTARDEIYKPINDFLSEHGGRVVPGPDGPTTLQDLENERAQTSAQLRQLKSGGPEGIALATQKGLTQADLIARQNAIEGAMDPHLMGAGIDSPLIRQTYGQVARVGDQFSGRFTPAEKTTPYGFGRMLNMKIDNPRSWFGAPAQGIRDLLAGRPLWSGNSGDVGVSEAFRAGGPKPDFRAPYTSMPAWQNPPHLLEANVPGNADYGDIDVGSMAGIPHPGPQIGMAPPTRPLLPASSSAGEVQPMIRYATPYNEPYDPGLRPFSAPEYLAPPRPYQSPLITKPLLSPQETQ